MAADHTRLLEALRLPDPDDDEDSILRRARDGPDDDDTSSTNLTPSDTRSISLDTPSFPPIPPTNPPERVMSPSTIAETELASESANYSAPATTRTSISSQVFSVVHADEGPSGLDAKLRGMSLGTNDSPSSPHHNEGALEDAMSSTVTAETLPQAAPALATDDENSITAPPLNRVSTTSSSASSLGRKVRPDSLILKDTKGPLILGIALVDFNHSVGPKVEMAHPPALLEDEELCKILPFLALPDGAHQSAEDYAYFHLTLQDPSIGVSSSSQPETVFGISCNRQIAASDLLEKDADVSRSTVQKAVVVLASKPLFGLIRDRLGVVTSALFNQRDFRDTHILVDFMTNLEISVKNQLTESGLYMGTNLRELIHKFRSRTLVLVKLLMLQKKIMFYGHPVERLCTYQYSLVSLIPNLLLGLEDAASPNLDRREKDTSKPTELRTSDRNSLMRYLGLPLNVFGRDAFFQPYLPLQQVDMLKTQSWLCGTTNTIVTQQRDSLPDLLINIETNTFEFKNPQVERYCSLTAADRKWMDDIVRDVNEGWNESDPSRPLTMQFKGSDDYLRAKFEDYVSSALASVKYADHLIKTGAPDAKAFGATGDENCIANFGEAWIGAFRQAHAYTVWNQQTDPSLFDIIEPRHPCDTTPTIMSDVGLRLAEGLHDMKVAETIAPAREALSNAFTAGSTGFFRAFEGVRSEVAARMVRQPSTSSSGAGSTPVQVSPPSSVRDVSPSPARTSYPPLPATPTAMSPSAAGPRTGGLRPLSLAPAATVATDVGGAAKATISSWGSWIGKKAAEYKRGSASTTTSIPEEPSTPPTTARQTPTVRSPPLSNARGALWSLGERGQQTASIGEKDGVSTPTTTSTTAPPP